MKVRKKTKKIRKLENVVIVGIFVLLVILTFNAYTILNLQNKLNAKIDELNKLTKLTKKPEIEIIKLISSCVDCFNVDEIVKNLKESKDLTITDEKSLDSSSIEGKEFISKYKIEKLPTIILKGDVNRTSLQNFKQEGDALIFDEIAPPYEDANTKKIVGKVSTIIISDKKCKVCPDFSIVIQNLKQQGGVFISKQEEIDFEDAKGKELINKFKIKKLPSVFISDDIDAYPTIAQSIQQFASQKQDSYYIFESQAPYVESDTGIIHGLIDLIMLTDLSCKNCYNVSIHKQILSGMGLAISQEKTLDIKSEEGAKLIEKYNITKIPTIILSGDLDIYTGFNNVWSQVGTIESDKAYIFRKIEVLGLDIVYRNISA